MRTEIEIILDTIKDAVVAIDSNCIIRLFNTAASNLVNITSSDAVGKNIKDVIENTRLPDILVSGEPEYNCAQDLNDHKIITNRIPVKDDEGNITGAIAVFRDISDIAGLSEENTELKRMKSMMSAIINATQDAITVVDQNCKGILINPAYTKMTGLSEQDVLGKPSTVDITEGESIHLQVIETKKPVKGAFIKVGPNHREVLVNAAPIIVDGELKGSVGVIQDVTEINKLSTELRHAKDIIRKLEAKYTFDDIIGSAPQIIEAVNKAKKASETSVTVLLRGESGTGKEIFAHAIHNSSDRKYNQFIRVNCAAVADTLLESQLFGYEEGAFTGAQKGGRKGLFEEANGGTIFLDEIGEIQTSAQTKLLRVLQEKELVRVGGTKPIGIDVRVIAATNVDLEAAIAVGKFRSDLFYRLNVFPIEIPSLRERTGDISGLVSFFIKKFNQQYGRNIEGISKGALIQLGDYSWPGNIRELENIIGRAIINMKTNEKTIETFHFPVFDKQPINREDVRPGSADQFDDSVRDESYKQMEKAYVLRILKQCNNNKTKAAKLMNISIRGLYYKLERYGIK